MSSKNIKIRSYRNEEYFFHCPGCKQVHSINNKWQYNRDPVNPTISPSIFIRSGHYAPHYKPEDNCWCKYNAEQVANGEPESGFSCVICHSFVKDGMIQFLPDCTHELVGQTVEIPPWFD